MAVILCFRSLAGTTESLKQGIGRDGLILGRIENRWVDNGAASSVGNLVHGAACEKAKGR